MPGVQVLPLVGILNRLRESVCTGPNDYEKHREAIGDACQIADSQFFFSYPSLDDFRQFLQESHDLATVSASPLVRTTILRTILLVLKAADDSVSVDQYVSAMAEEQWNWIVCMTLERAPLMEKQAGDDRRVDRGGDTFSGDTIVVRQDFVFERMAALKLLRMIMAKAPARLHVSTVRSLVAVAQNPKDNIRRVCIETLREMCMCNAQILIQSGGVNALQEAIYDPAFTDMIVPITNSILFILNNPSTRKYLRPYLDLRSFIAPFTDIDTSESDLLPRRRAAKVALVCILRSWVGVAMLASDDLGLPTLIGLLRDPKVPVSTQNIILDIMLEVFEPIFARVRRSRQARRNDRYQSRTLCISSVMSEAISADSLNVQPLSSDAREEENQHTAVVTPPSIAAKFGMQVGSSANKMLAGTASKDLHAVTHDSLNETLQTTEKKKVKRQSFFGSLFGSSSSPATTNDVLKVPDTLKLKEKGRATSAGGGPVLLHHDPSHSEKLAAAVDQAATSRDEKTHSLRRRVIRDVNTVSTAYVDNVLWNALDNYAAFLCCALLHAEAPLSLAHLGTHGDTYISSKARCILVEIMRTISHILPDEHCAQLLNMSTLMEFSSLTRASNTNIRANKASEMLELLADAFSVAPRDYRCSQHLPRYCSVTPAVQTFGFKAYHNKQGAPTPEEESRNYYHQFAKVGILGIGIGKSQVISICAMADHMVPQESRKRQKQLMFIPGEAMKTQANMSFKSEINTDFAQFNGNAQINKPSTHIATTGDAAEGAEKTAGEATDLQLQDIRNMRTAIATTPADYVRLLDTTKVNGKEGKEPFKWNWEYIVDLLVHEFHDSTATQEAKGRRTSLTNTFSSKKGTNPLLSNSGILAEAMKSKWVRRMCGFYRCSTEQKGYFANLTWEPSNLNYLECAVLLHQCLVDDVNGQAFLRGDRRGMLYNEVASEIKTLLTAFDRSRPTASFFSMNRTDTGPSLNASSHVFRRYAMQGTLSREYFTLIGNILLKAGGQTIVDESEIFQHLSRSGHIPELDYFSRVVITSLVFTDRGFMSQHLIASWTSMSVDSALSSIGAARSRKGASTAPKAESTGGRRRAASTLSSIPVVGKGIGLCSVGLQNYIFNLLGVLLHARPAEFKSWGMDTVVDFLDKQVVGQVPLHLIRLLLQIVQRVEHLVILIDKLNERTRPDGKLSIDMTVDSIYKPILLYFLTVPQGLQYLRKGRGHALKDGSYLAQLLHDAAKDDGDAVRYVKEFETLMAKALSPAYLKDVISPSAHIKPIPYFTKDLSNAYSSSSEGDSIAATNAAQQRKMAETAANAAVPGGDGRASMYGGTGGRSSTSEASPSGGTQFSGIYDFGSKGGGPINPQPAVSSDVRATAAVELEGLLKLPWCIELKSFIPKESIYAENKSISIPSGCPGGEYIGLDTYADTSDLVMPATSEITADKNRFIKIRGFVLDEKGLPGGRAIKEGKVLGSSLMLGACPVSKKGEVSPSVQGGGQLISFEQARRNTATNLTVPPMRRASLGVDPTSPSGVPSHLDESDTPPTYMLEALYDWTVCNPIDNGIGNAVFTDLSETQFSVEIPGEPCKYIFSREKMTTSIAADAVGGPALPQKRSSIVNSLITGVSIIPGLGGITRKSIIDPTPQPQEQYYERVDEKTVYLLEVQYYIAIKTGQGPFAVIPPHPYGMLVRSHEGSTMLASNGIIKKLISTVQEDTPPSFASDDAAAVLEKNASAPATNISYPMQGKNSMSNTRRLKAALWALGHIASSDSGFEAITTEARKIHEAGKEAAFILKKAHQLSQSQIASQLLNESKGDDLPMPLRLHAKQEEGIADGTLRGTEKMHRSKSNDSINSIDGEITHDSGVRPPLPPSSSDGNLSQASPSAFTDASSKTDLSSDANRFHVQPAFPLVEWCVRMVREHPNYSVRATVFSVLGLISRSGRGKTLLNKYEWESASHGSSSAVSVPKNASALFARSADDDVYDREALAQPVPERMKQILAFVPHYSSLDLQVLQLIAKLNGSPGSNAMARLQHMTKEKPEVFESRELFVNVMQMFETYAFSLKDRREIVELFSDKAKQRHGGKAESSGEEKK